jgi:DNA-binding MarR family transcriptional regulator
MQRAVRPSPAAARVLRRIERMLAANDEPTIGTLAKALHRSRTAIADALRRLERGKFINRSKFKPGSARKISLPKPKRRRKKGGVK